MIVHYEARALQEHRRTIVFGNGMTQSTAHWRSHVRALSQRYGVITYDARGQGKTPAGSDPLTLPLHADDVAAMLDDAGIERAVFVGFSHGARIGLQFANTHPDRAEKLVLVSATASPTALARTIIRSWREVLDRGGLEAMAWASLPAILGSDYLRDSERILAGIIKASVDRNDEDGVRRLLDAMIDYPSLAELARGVTAPALVISADQDLLVTPEGARELAALCSADHELVTGCGHTIPIERPELFRSLLERFLTSG